MIFEKDKKFKCYFVFIALIMWFQILYLTISFGQIKLVPHNKLQKHMTDTTDKLLTCAGQKIPSLNNSWNLLKNCAHDIQIYHVPKSNVPRSKFKPLAFVTPHIWPNDVFVVKSEYALLSNTYKAITVIHECTHLVLNTVDHAYLWQSNFNSLTLEKHFENADSYVNIILNNCINDIYVF